MGLKQRKEILGLPVGPKQFSVARVAWAIIGALTAVVAFVIGRDLIMHSSSSQNGDSSSDSESEDSTE